ncbi:4-alpha-glucanotransferase [Dysgonomonadaceae bacterium PH5-43]|nr:4-alpha-glucanotransferase [Dysgonomonadaceae bacterium PH5-43]
MKIKFHINFHTVWGQTLFIVGSIPELGEWSTERAKQMNYVDDGNWSYEIELPDNVANFEYRYFMKSNEQIIFEEWNRNHNFSTTDIKRSYRLFDFWLNRPQNQSLYSSAFTKSWFAHPCNRFEKIVKAKKKIIIKVLAPSIKKNESIALLGNQDVIGSWSADNAIVLSCDNHPEWFAEFDSEHITYPIEYKLCIIDNDSRSIVRWESGENRTLNIPYVDEEETVVVSGLQFNDENNEWRCAGLSIPVFSLKSESSFGFGDFKDLYKIVDWVRLTGQKLIQILPINDTTMSHTRVDSYPYNSISIYALHPLYINIEELGTLDNSERDAFYKAKQEELNSLALIDYDAVDYWKWNFFREIFIQEGQNTLTTQEFALFFENNKEWLVPYAAYSYLRDKHETPVFLNWDEYSTYNRYEIEKLCAPNSIVYKEISLYYFLQFHAHKQLKKAHDYACSCGVVLKGDIPIGISRVSVEAWTEPNYFNMFFQAGAPPDDFSALGQNWGFPTYNWEIMEDDCFAWWKKRFSKMSDFFDAYRIDHILGFFRIWQIPSHSVDAILGHFYPAMPLSIEEIESNGLIFKKENFTYANINEKYLKDIFGEYASEVEQVFLNRMNAEHFCLKEQYNTQRKIQAYFAQQTDDKSHFIKQGLFTICNEVLFIEDNIQKDYYHPRISASSTHIYEELSNADKYAFDCIYWNYFYQRHNEFWKGEALKHLAPIINSTNMLVCGEDLGMIPHSVPEVMEKLQILSLEIERMPKTPEVEFANLKEVPYLSVCTTSTHDMSTIRGWWIEDRDKTQRYYNEVLGLEGDAPSDATPEICRQIIANHLRAKSMLVVIPFQDWLSIDGVLRNPDIEVERINIPANARHYWRYRMHLSIEQLLSADSLNEVIKEMIAVDRNNITE